MPCSGEDQFSRYWDRERGLSSRIGMLLLISVAVVLVVVIGGFYIGSQAIGSGGSDVLCSTDGDFPSILVSSDQSKVTMNALAQDTRQDGNVRKGLVNETYTDKYAVEMTFECGESISQDSISIYVNGNFGDAPQAIGTPEQEFEGARNQNRTQTVDPLWNPDESGRIKPQDSVTIHGFLRPDLELGSPASQTSSDLLEGNASCRVWGNNSLTFDSQPKSHVAGIGECRLDEARPGPEHARRLKRGDDIDIYWTAPNAPEKTVLLNVHTVESEAESDDTNTDGDVDQMKGLD